jgi:hypothetical protein
VVTGHACLAPLLADTGGVWGAAAIKLRFFLATIGVLFRAKLAPLAPGHIAAPLNAAKPGGGLWVDDAGHACLRGSPFGRCRGRLGSYRHKVKVFLGVAGAETLLYQRGRESAKTGFFGR